MEQGSPKDPSKKSSTRDQKWSFILNTNLSPFHRNDKTASEENRVEDGEEQDNLTL